MGDRLRRATDHQGAGRTEGLRSGAGCTAVGLRGGASGATACVGGLLLLLQGGECDSLLDDVALVRIKHVYRAPKMSYDVL